MSRPNMSITASPIQNDDTTTSIARNRQYQPIPELNNAPDSTSSPNSNTLASSFSPEQANFIKSHSAFLIPSAQTQLTHSTALNAFPQKVASQTSTPLRETPRSSPSLLTTATTIENPSYEFFSHVSDDDTASTPSDYTDYAEIPHSHSSGDWSASESTTSDTAIRCTFTPIPPWMYVDEEEPISFILEHWVRRFWAWVKSCGEDEGEVDVFDVFG
ncbi:MAG: hypothetical protein Q9171_000212 [Xanthocarpia ochracea]